MIEGFFFLFESKIHCFNTAYIAECDYRPQIVHAFPQNEAHMIYSLS